MKMFVLVKMEITLLAFNFDALLPDVNHLAGWQGNSKPYEPVFERIVRTKNRSLSAALPKEYVPYILPNNPPCSPERKPVSHPALLLLLLQTYRQVSLSLLAIGFPKPIQYQDGLLTGRTLNNFVLDTQLRPIDPTQDTPEPSLLLGLLGVGGIGLRALQKRTLG
jgi:hypothetical protein